jgi:8-oxo-dGTP diphosphatase
MSHIQTKWVDDKVPSTLPITQVYGYCFDTQSRILLYKDLDCFNLPGGKPENEESIEETLYREVLEEVQTFLEDAFYIGYQLVENDPSVSGGKYAQVRMIARIKEMFPLAIDPASNRRYERLFCTVEGVATLLNWGASGEGQIRTACKWARLRWGLNLNSSF